MTTEVWIGKLALVFPTGTVTDSGSFNPELGLFDSVTITPPAMAGADSKTVPCEGIEPVTEAGDKVRLTNESGATIVSEAVFVMPPELAEMVAELLVVTDPAVTLKVTEVAPPGTETSNGTEAKGEELCSETTSPPDGAAFKSLTVAVVVPPPITVDAAKVKALKGIVFTCVPIA